MKMLSRCLLFQVYQGGVLRLGCRWRVSEKVVASVLLLLDAVCIFTVNLKIFVMILFAQTS